MQRAAFARISAGQTAEILESCRSKYPITTKDPRSATADGCPSSPMPLALLQTAVGQASIAIARCLARLAARSCHHQLRGACQPAAPPAIVALPPALHGYRCRLRPLAAVRSEQSLGAEDSSLLMLAFGVAALDGLMPKPTQSWPIHSVLRHTATPVPLRPPPFPRTAKAKSWVQRCSSPPASHLLPDRIES